MFPTISKTRIQLDFPSTPETTTVNCQRTRQILRKCFQFITHFYLVPRRCVLYISLHESFLDCYPFHTPRIHIMVLLITLRQNDKHPTATTAIVLQSWSATNCGEMDLHVAPSHM